MSNQHTSQEEVSDELKKSITPRSEEEIERGKGIKERKGGTKGIYKISLLGANSSVLTDVHDPSDDKAVGIDFRVTSSDAQPLPKDQLDLRSEIAKVIRTIDCLYRSNQDKEANQNKVQFREYFVRLFRLAQLGLEGDNVSPEAAKIELTSVIEDLIDDEAGRIKNGHLVELAKGAILLSIFFGLAYISLREFPLPLQLIWNLGIDPLMLSNFMMLWIGCFIGVCLSYGIRTTNFTLLDLTVPNTNRLKPKTRLLFAGNLTMLLGMILCFDLVDIRIGNLLLSDFSSQPMLAFLLGSLCGISESLLPTVMGRRSHSFMKVLNKS